MDYHAEYALHTLLYLARLASDDDHEAARQMGLDGDSIEQIQSLNARDLHELAQMLKSPVMVVQFDKNVFSAVITLCKNKTKHQTLINKMIKAEASFALMNYLFGFNRSELTAYRRNLNITTSSGRPEIPTDSEKEKIWEIWKKHQNESLAEQLIIIHDLTGLKISSIWLALKEWIDGLEKANDKTN